jgi:hypothetical protein
MISRLHQSTSDSFLSGDYRKTVASLDDTLALVKAREVAPQLIAQQLWTIPQNAERVHDAKVKQTTNGKGTLHHHTLVVRKGGEVVNELAMGESEFSAEIIRLSAEIHYLMRNLDKAIVVLKENEEKIVRYSCLPPATC